MIYKNVNPNNKKMETQATDSDSDTATTIFEDETKKYVCPDGSKIIAEQIPGDIETLIIDRFDNDCKWKHLTLLVKSKAKESISTLYLGHDGCIYGDKSDIETVITGLPNLKKVFYCGYYAKYRDDLLEIAEKRGVECIRIL